MAQECRVIHLSEEPTFRPAPPRLAMPLSETTLTRKLREITLGIVREMAIRLGEAYFMTESVADGTR